MADKSPAFYWLPVQWLVAAYTHLIFWFGDLASYIVVPFAIWLGWDTKVFGKRIFWGWDAYPNPRTGTYYDPWYDNLNSPTHTAISKWASAKGGFWKEYYWRTRNAFSNATRYGMPWPNAVPTDLYRRDFSNGAYYQYDVTRPWLAKYRSDRYYIGFKFERNEGFGITHRGIPSVLFVVAHLYLIARVVL